MKRILIIITMLMNVNMALAEVHCASGEETDYRDFQDLIASVESVININFSQIIDSSSMNALIKRIDKEIRQNPNEAKEIVITLGSPGGDINAALRAVRFIKQLNLDPLISINTKVTPYNTCDSACTILFTAGKKRLASRHSRFGFHSPMFESGKLNGVSRKEIEETYRNIWLATIAQVDVTTALLLETNRYLIHDDMRYISGKDLVTGYVTDLL